MNIEIRNVMPEEAGKLVVLKQQVWISTYATEGINEEFSGYVLSEFTRKKVLKSVLDQDRLTLGAYYNQNLTGCAEIILLPERPHQAVKPCPEIATLYVLDRFQDQGIGKMLLTECLHRLQELGFLQTWLTVYYRNEKAIRFYEKLNFLNVGETDFKLGFNRYKNYIMLKDL